MRRYIAIDSIVVPADRQRREFDPDAMQELQASILRTGLLHAPVLELSEGLYVLRAGERRLGAIRDIYDLGGTFSYDGEPVPPGLVPHTLWEELTPIQRLELEVEENQQREPFTWQERVTALDKLAKLRRMQAEEAGRPAPTHADLSEETRGERKGYHVGQTAKELALARHLSNPLVAKAKTAAEAFTALKRVERAEKHSALAARVGAQVLAERYTLVNGDAETWCKGQPAGGFEIILTDPPYGIGAHEFGEADEGTASAHGYEDSAEVLTHILGWFPAESHRLAAAGAHLYVFLDIDWWVNWSDALAAAGWRVFRTPLVWVKPTGFRTPWITQGPQRKYELILYAVKGDKPVNFIGPDVLQVQSPGQGLGHPAAKPPELFAELLKRSAVPGDRVLDPFCGTGPVFPAAAGASCFATGVEVVPQFYGIAAERVEGLLAKGGV